MCASTERLSNKRLLNLEGRKSAARTLRPERRRSMKKSFLRKIMSPLLGYDGGFELLQYAYNLHMWTMLGSRKNLTEGTATGTTMKTIIKGHPMSPSYWNNIRFGLQNLVR